MALSALWFGALLSSSESNPDGWMERGKVVVVAGMPRSGSTALYNMVRLVMQEQDPNLIPLSV